MSSAAKKAKKIESSFVNMVVVLLLIALISAGILAATYEYTKEDIAGHQLAKQIAAIDAVLPEYDNNILEDQRQIDGMSVFPAYSGGSLVGVAVLGFSDRAFSGEMEVMAGFSPDGTLLNATAVRHAETPGLGSKVNDERFASQFTSIDMTAADLSGDGNNSGGLAVRKDGGEIDSITAATISSRAYCHAVNTAWNSARQFFGGRE
ncbi:RnfABCDGE type electron transport complex subunit G [Salinispira pacifica]|uniref:Ion-translocating oxidoreductase complex subunit G n=1 Tax=Salinispira pacifica TaxID=1307761 RepID=V5WDM3_9SPIO|nr:RnfABCDGE type electron transport complex subunit G [Salinispira pacifica]AHC13882.1 Electron transport complex protein RnfG [Salinispira pacifica]